MKRKQPHDQGPPAEAPGAFDVHGVSPVGGVPGLIRGARVAPSTHHSAGGARLEQLVVVLDALSDEGIPEALRAAGNVVIRCRSLADLLSTALPSRPRLVVIAPNLPDASLLTAVAAVLETWPVAVWPLGLDVGPATLSRLDWAVAALAADGWTTPTAIGERLALRPEQVADLIRSIERRTGLSIDQLGMRLRLADSRRTAGKEGGIE